MDEAERISSDPEIEGYQDMDSLKAALMD